MSDDYGPGQSGTPEAEMSGDSRLPPAGPIPTPERPNASALNEGPVFPPPVRIPPGAVPTSIDWSIMVNDRDGATWGVMTLSTPVGQWHFWFPSAFVREVVGPMMRDMEAAVTEPTLHAVKPSLILASGPEAVRAAAARAVERRPT